MNETNNDYSDVIRLFETVSMLFKDSTVETLYGFSTKLLIKKSKIKNICVLMI